VERVPHFAVSVFEDDYLPNVVSQRVLEGYLIALELKCEGLIEVSDATIEKKLLPLRTAVLC
jgi:hypothetical protein